MLKTRIFEEYTRLQNKHFKEVKKTPHDVIEHYTNILKKIEIIAEPLSEKLQRIQRHAYRGIGFMYQIQDQPLLAKRYFDQANQLKRLNETHSYFAIQSSLLT